MENKKIASGLAIGITLILAVVIGGIFWWQNKKENLKNVYSEEQLAVVQEQSSQLITEINVQKSQTTSGIADQNEAVSALTYPLGKHLLTFNMSVPKNWRTTLEKWDDMKLQYAAYNDNLAVFNFLSPHYPHPDDSGLVPKNELGFFDVTEWIERDSVDEFENVQKSSEKKEYFDFLINLRDKKQKSDFSKCKSVYSYVCGGHEIKYVESSDGIFSGFASVKFSPQSYEYSPEIYIYMTGKIANKIIYIKGHFVLYDDNRYKIDEALKNKNDVNALTKEAFEQFDKNGLPNDSQKQYDEILDVVKSITVDASERKSY